MKERTHGGDCAAFERAYGAAPLDFSASVSPLGVPEGARAALCAAAGEADRYPDPACRALRDAIAAYEGVPADWALCGAGASDLIYRAVYAAKPRRVLVTAPCFGEYETAAEAAGCEVLRYPLDADFRLDAGVLDALDGADLAFFCQPNNPSGVSIAPALLRKLAETRRRVVVDECFLRFLDAPERCGVKPLLAAFPNLVALDAPTKTHALAGARLGWALCADAAFLGAMRRAGPPWAVSSLAQAAGVAALQDKEYLACVRKTVRTERAWLSERLAALGLRVAAGEANFLLFRCETPLDAHLRAREILIRSCADFAGLDETWYRAAVRTRAENERLVGALREVLT